MSRPKIRAVKGEQSVRRPPADSGDPVEQPHDSRSPNERTDPSAAGNPWPARLRKSLHLAWVAVRSVLQFLLVAWGTLAIYFSNLPWAWARLVLAVAFATF